MTLRLADSTDIPLIRALAHRIWWAHYPAIITSAQIEYMLDLMYSEGALAQQMQEGQVFRFVEMEGTPIGYLSISKKGEGQYFMHKFYLESEQQGKGIGAEAFRLVLTQYPDLQELRLVVNRRNFKSVNFYFKNGFVIEEWFDAEIGQGYVMDDFRMVWKKRV